MEKLIENFRSILQMCRKQTRSLRHVKKVHLLICGNGVEALDIGNMLVQIYMESGHFSDAVQVFQKLVNRSELSWTCLIQAYNDNGEFHEALQVFSHMQEDYVHPSKFTYVGLLKTASGLEDVERVLEIHKEVVIEELETDPFICNTLLSAYAKCGSLLEATRVFESLSVVSTVSWTALIQGYSGHSFHDDALRCFSRMQNQGECPNAFTYSTCLKTCGAVNAINRGKQIHSSVIKQGIEIDIAVDNALVYMYAKFGLLLEAEKVFELLPTQDVITWTALIAGCVGNGLVEIALNYFHRMQIKGVPINDVTCIEALKACSSFGYLETGKGIHIDVVKRGYDNKIVVANAVVDMYAKNCSVWEARMVFDCLEYRSVITWNTLLGGYCCLGLGTEALVCLEEMRRNGVGKDDATFICALRVSSIVRSLVVGQQIHAEITKTGCECDYSIGNSLVEMYAKCSALEESLRVFMELPVKNAIAWTPIIAYYIEYGQCNDALNILKSMQQEGVYLDVTVFLYGLQACACMADQSRGQELHIEILKQGIEGDPFVANSLVDMYGKCYLLEAASYVFGQLSEDSVVSWSAFIAGHVENGLGEETLSLLEKMQLSGRVSPNAAIFVSSLKACSTIGAISKGQELYCDAIKKGFISSNAHKSTHSGGERTNPVEEIIGNALIDMYAKCGSLDDALFIFEQMHVRSVAMWNTLISGFTSKGETDIIFHYFDKMTNNEQFLQSEVTFLAILNACNHDGLLEKGQQVLMTMYEAYRTMLTIEHYNCIIDLLCRAGQLHEAVKVLEKMPLHPNMATWNAILAACQKSANVELGEWALESISRSDEKYIAAFIAMHNIYASAVVRGEEARIG